GRRADGRADDLVLAVLDHDGRLQVFVWGNDSGNGLADIKGDAERHRGAGAKGLGNGSAIDQAAGGADFTEGRHRRRSLSGPLRAARWIRGLKCGSWEEKVFAGVLEAGELFECRLEAFEAEIGSARDEVPAGAEVAVDADCGQRLVGRIGQ